MFKTIISTIIAGTVNDMLSEREAAKAESEASWTVIKFYNWLATTGGLVGLGVVAHKQNTRLERLEAKLAHTQQALELKTAAVERLAAAHERDQELLDELAAVTVMQRTKRRAEKKRAEEVAAARKVVEEYERARKLVDEADRQQPGDNGSSLELD